MPLRLSGLALLIGAACASAAAAEGRPDANAYLSPIDGAAAPVWLNLEETPAGLRVEVTRGRLDADIDLWISDACPTPAPARTSGVSPPVSMGRDIAATEVGSLAVAGPSIHSPTTGVGTGTVATPSTDPGAGTSADPGAAPLTTPRTAASVQQPSTGRPLVAPTAAEAAAEETEAARYLLWPSAPNLRPVRLVPTGDGYEIPGVYLGDVVGASLFVEWTDGRVCGNVRAVPPPVPSPMISG